MERKYAPSGTPDLDRRFRGIGRIKRASGTKNPETYRLLNEMLTTLFNRGSLDVLRALRDATYTPLEVYDAFRRDDLENLPGLPKRPRTSEEEITKLTEELRQLNAGVRRELAELMVATAEARRALCGQAKREPLPVPTDHVPPPIAPSSILCDSLRMPEYVVYALVDPNDPELVRYVGRASDPVGRYRSHCSMGSESMSSWVQWLMAQDRMPVMVLLERCSPETIADREVYWIRYYRERAQADLNRIIPKMRLA